MYQKLDAFLERHSQHIDQITDLGKYMDAEPLFAEPADFIPAVEYERRILAVEKLLADQRKVRGEPGWHFSALQFSTLMAMPLTSLQKPGLDQFNLLHQLNDQLHSVVFHFFQKRGQEEEPDLRMSSRSGISSKRKGKEPAAGDLPRSAKRPASNTSNPTPTHPGSQALSGVLPQDKERARNKTQAKKCRELDHHRCVVTGARDPEVCHIIPFAWNSTTRSATKTAGLLATLRYFFNFGSSQLATLIIAPSGSDRAWNMIALNPTLHTWWSKGYFAFKYMGREDLESTGQSRVQLQFRWMPRSIDSEWRRPVNLEHEKDPMNGLLAQLAHHYGRGAPSVCNVDDGCDGCDGCDKISGVAAVDLRTHRPIRSGHLFYVTRETSSVDSFKAMIELQWAIIHVAAMSGAATAVDLQRLDDDDDFWSEDNIIDWQKEVVSEHKDELGREHTG